MSPEPQDSKDEGTKEIEIPPLLPVLPLREGVIFPMSVAPVVVQDERAVRAVEDAMRTHRMLCAVAQREDAPTPLVPESLYAMGCAVAIRQFQRAPDGPILVVLQGVDRLRIQGFPQTDPYFIAAVERTPDTPSTGIETEALGRRLRVLFRELGELGRAVPEQVIAVADGLTDPVQLAYLIAATAPLPRSGRQDILQLDPVEAKLRRLVELLEHELSVRRVEQEVASRTQQRISKQQREHLLREQLRSIQSELNEEGEGSSETAELRKRIEETPLSARGTPRGGARAGPAGADPLPSRPSSGLRAGTWTGSWRFPGERRPAGPSRSRRRGPSSTRTTTIWRRSRSGSSTTCRSGSSARSGRPAWPGPARGMPRMRRRRVRCR